MDRIIKFRAYIKKDYNKELVGKILEVSSIHLKRNKVIIGYSLSKSNYGNHSFNYENIELMQFTGIYDKNGKEIYDGDIVYIDAYTYEGPEFDGEYIVRYNDVLGMWILIDLDKYDKDDITNITDFMTFEDLQGWYKIDVKLIGNIYNNKGLLEEE